MNGHDAQAENTGAYALDALSEIEARAFERHLAGCLECRAEVRRLRVAVAALACLRGAAGVAASSNSFAVVSRAVAFRCSTKEDTMSSVDVAGQVLSPHGLGRPGRNGAKRELC